MEKPKHYTFSSCANDITVVVQLCVCVPLSVLLALITLNGADSWERIPRLICSHCVFGMITFPPPILSQHSVRSETLRLLAVLT